MKTAMQPNFTQIPNILIDDWMPQLSDTAFRVIIIIARQTYGWIENIETGRRKEKDWIAYSQLEEKTGRQKQALTNAIRELEEKSLIEVLNYEGLQIPIIQRRGKRLYYRINTKFNYNMGENHPNMGENQTSKITHTKETNTKETIQNDNTIVLSENPSRGNPDINDISLYFKEKFQIPKEGCTYKQSRQYWYLLLKESRKGSEGVKWLIDLAANDSFYRHNISSSKDLYYIRIKLITRMRGGVNGYAKRGIDATNL